MKINFIGNFANGYVGEVADETHLVRELKALGHKVVSVPRDQWKAYVDGEDIKDDWVLPKEADINIIAKWHHFNDKEYIVKLQEETKAPVFYWVWDYMWDPKFPDWHLAMAQQADLYLSGELGLAALYREYDVKFYYFQMDVCDGEIPVFDKFPLQKKYDVVFTGSHLGQGDRDLYLQSINQALPGKLQIFSWNYEEWKKRGFEAYPAVYGAEYNQLIGKAKLVLGFSVEPNCYGYWSNRIGKVIRAGGYLLQQYAPGMEQLVHHDLHNVDFFSTISEAVSKIREHLMEQSWEVPNYHTDKWTSKAKMKQLTILMERFLKEEKGRNWILP